MPRLARAPAAALALLLVFHVASAAALVNINTADAVALDALPGIGPAKAAAIVSYRASHGPFARIEDIENVSGIGPATFAKLEADITVGGSASTTPVQPAGPAARLEKVQTVDSAVRSDPKATEHPIQAVETPAAAQEAAVAGALQPAPTRAGAGLLHSSWMLGLLGVIAFAGGAFMIL